MGSEQSVRGSYVIACLSREVTSSLCVISAVLPTFSFDHTRSCLGSYQIEKYEPLDIVDLLRNFLATFSTVDIYYGSLDIAFILLFLNLKYNLN